MHAKKLFQNDPANDLSNSKIFVESLIVLQSRALAYYYMLTSTEVIWTKGIKTAATDGIYVYINPDFFKKLANPSQRAFLLGHEVGHIVFKHNFRGRFYKERGYFAMTGSKQVPYSHKGYNHAGDYVINADLIAHGLEFIPNCLLRDDFNRDDIVDSVYMTLWQEHEKKQEELEQQRQDQDDDDESCDDADESEVDDADDQDADDQDADDQDADESEGDESDDDSGDDADDTDESSEGDESEGDPEGEDDEEDAESGAEGGSEASDEDMSGDGGDPFGDSLEGDAHDEHLEPEYDGDPDEVEDQIKEDQDEVARKIDEAIDALDDAKERGEPQVGASKQFTEGGNRFSGGNASSTNWRDELADRVTRIGGSGEADWSRIHRRRFAVMGVLTPSYKSTFDRLAISVDISSSVCRTALNQFMIEVASLLDAMTPASGCLVMFTNTEVVKACEVFSGAELLDLEVPEGGGTTMSAAVNFMEENGLDADIHLCFTDGELWGNDMQNLADNGVVMVLDTVPSTWTQRDIDKTGIETIVACDQAA